jgi:hypothetical protein
LSSFWGPLQSIGVKDNNAGSYLIFTDSKRVTSIGPVEFEGYKVTYQIGNQLGIVLYLKNNAQTATATDVTAELYPKDSSTISNITKGTQDAIDINANETVETKQTFTITTIGSPNTLDFYIKIFSDGFHFWTDSSLATFIKPMEQELPKKFSLSQNYPNPFNPKTVISWQLPVGSDVDLSIYNVLGQKVATLVNRKQQAGSYSAEWDATGFASGVYYYRLVAGEYVATRKLVLLR